MEQVLTLNSLARTVHVNLAHRQRCPAVSKYKHVALRPQKRDGLIGTGVGGEVMARPRNPTRKTEEAVDHRQNNNYVKAVGNSPLVSKHGA